MIPSHREYDSNNVFDRLFKQETASSLSLKKRISAPSGRVAVSKVLYDGGMRRAKAKAKKKIVQECDDNFDTRLASAPNAASIGVKATKYDEVEKESINDVLSEESSIEEEGPRTSAPSGRVAVSKPFYDGGMRRTKKAKAKKKIVQECDDNFDNRLASTPNAASVGVETTEDEEIEKESINDVLSEGRSIEEEGPSQSEIRRSALKLNISSRYNPENGFFFSFEQS